MFPVIVVFVVVVVFFHRVMKDKRLRTIKYYYRGGGADFLIYLSVQQLRLYLNSGIFVKNPKEKCYYYHGFMFYRQVVAGGLFFFSFHLWGHLLFHFRNDFNAINHETRNGNWYKKFLRWNFRLKSFHLLRLTPLRPFCLPWSQATQCKKRNSW